MSKSVFVLSFSIVRLKRAFHIDSLNLRYVKETERFSNIEEHVIFVKKFKPEWGVSTIYCSLFFIIPHIDIQH